MDSIIAAATLILPLTLGVTEIVKRYFGGKKILPVINLVMGIILGAAWAWSFSPNDILTFVWGGAIAGMSAGGFFDLGSNIVDKFKIDESEFR